MRERREWSLDYLSRRASIPAALGIAKLTARSQIKSVYGKLDIHNQRDLVAILARI